MTAYILNLLDLLFTLHALSHGAFELNPLMRCVPVMIFWKVIGVGLLLRWMAGRQERIAQLGLKLIAAVYAAINVWHVINIFRGLA